MEGRVGKYQIKRELGKGGSSIVYLAFDEFYNSDVAVKVYHSHAGSTLSDGARSKIVSEAALAGKLVHPHIITILDAMADEQQGYVAMEYVPGGNLHRYTVPSRLLPVDDVIQVAFKCCGALDYAYREGVVHRDIKPANILVASGTDVKVADFGAAFVRGLETTYIESRRDSLLILRPSRYGTNRSRIRVTCSRWAFALRTSGRLAAPSRDRARATYWIVCSSTSQPHQAVCAPDLPGHSIRWCCGCWRSPRPTAIRAGRSWRWSWPGSDVSDSPTSASPTARNSRPCGPQHSSKDWTTRSCGNWCRAQAGSAHRATRSWCAKARPATVSFSCRGRGQGHASGQAARRAAGGRLLRRDGLRAR